MQLPDTVQAFFGSMIGVPDLLGGLLDEDTSARVRGILVIILVAMGGWFAHDYVDSNLTKADIAPLMINQRINAEMVKQNARELCRERGNTARNCEQMIQNRYDAIESQVISNLDFEGTSEGE